MDIEVVKAYPQDFERILPLLQGFRNVTQLDKTAWQRQFNFPFGKVEDHCGYMLLADQKPVGFLGAIFSQRMIRGKLEKFCDLAAWIVDENYRNNSLSLLFPVLREKYLTITTFTASNRVQAVLRKLGFKDIETALQILISKPSLKKSPILIFDLDQIESRLSGVALQIFRNHKHLQCWHVLLDTPDGPCYLMLNKSMKKRIPLGNIDTISDRNLFTKYIRHSIFPVCNHFHIYGLVLGGHFGISRIPFSLQAPRRHANLFRSSTLQPEDIDLVYSEVQVLGLLPT